MSDSIKLVRILGFDFVTGSAVSSRFFAVFSQIKAIYFPLLLLIIMCVNSKEKGLVVRQCSGIVQSDDFLKKKSLLPLE